MASRPGIFQFPPKKAVNPRVRQGVTGTYNTFGYLDQDLEYNGLLTKDNWIGTQWQAGIVTKMLRSDAQVHATIEAVNLSIKSGRWTVDAASDAPEDMAARDFIYHVLFERHNFEDLLNHILLYLPYGYSVFETVLSNDSWRDGRYTVARIEPRLPWTIERWITKNERLDYIIQQTSEYYGPINSGRLIILSNRRTGNNYTGVSVLRSAYKNWKIKDHLQKLQAVAYERTATPIIWAECPWNVTEEDREIIKTFAQNLRSNEENYVITTKKGANNAAGWQIEFIQMKDIVQDVSKAIAAHDVQIARNLLLDMISLGDMTSNRGSNALMQTKKDFFLTGLQAHAKYIVDVFNHGTPSDIIPSIIRRLVNLNFGPRDKYPTLSVSNLSAQNVQAIMRSAETLVNLKTAGMDTKTENYYRETLGAPVLNEEQNKNEDKKEGGEK